MALWEYKIIGSGKGGFGSPSLLESHLNQLGKDEWEIIAFNSHPENPLAFHGLARRTTQRDWTLQDAAAAAAKVEAEKLRAEFAAKFQAAQALTTVAEDKPSTLVAETASPEDGLRSLRDTDRDQDPEALADADDDDWKQLESEDELPTFFEFIRPHMRRNQRGPGMSLAVDYLANKIEQSPGEVVGALRECGFEIPEREDDDPVYLEYDGDLYWINTNRHHQLFINTKEKPRPVFRTSKGQPFAPPEKPDERAGRQDHRQRRPEPAAASVPTATPAAVVAPTAPVLAEGASPVDASATVELGSESSAADTAAPAPAHLPPAESQAPKGAPASPYLSSEASPGAVALMGRLRPMMRRNRRGPGVSGSVSFLSRALKQSDQELIATLATAGFVVPAQSNDKPVFTDVGVWTYWLNKDSRGGLWINGRERRDRDGRDRQDRSGGRPEAATREDEVPAPAESVEGVSPETTGAVGLPEGTVLPVADGSVAPVVGPVAETEPVSTPVVTEPVVEPVAPAAVVPPQETPSEPEPTPAAEAVVEQGVDAVESQSPADASLLASVRPLLKVKPRGVGASADLTSLAQALGRSDEVLLRELGAAGLVLPAEGEEKSPTVTLGSEQLWLQKSEKDGTLWVNAKAKPVRKPRAPGAPRRAPRKAAGGESEGGTVDGA